MPTCQFCLPVSIERNIDDNLEPFPKLYLLFACSNISLSMPVSLHPHPPKQPRKGQPGKQIRGQQSIPGLCFGDRHISEPQRAVALSAEDGIRRVRYHLSVLGFGCSDGSFNAVIEAQAGFNKVFKQSRK